MKAITLHQPWAQFLFCLTLHQGVLRTLKTFETRGWAPKDYQGPLLIHAAKTTPPAAVKALTESRDFMDLWEDCYSSPGHPEIGGFEPWVKSLPTGAIIGRVNLLECWTMDETKRKAILALRPWEKLIGDFSDRRRAWLLSDAWSLLAPIKATGRQGLWDYPDEFLKGAEWI